MNIAKITFYDLRTNFNVVLHYLELPKIPGKPWFLRKFLNKLTFAIARFLFWTAECCGAQVSVHVPIFPPAVSIQKYWFCYLQMLFLRINVRNLSDGTIRHEGWCELVTRSEQSDKFNAFTLPNLFQLTLIPPCHRFARILFVLHLFVACATINFISVDFLFFHSFFLRIFIRKKCCRSDGCATWVFSLSVSF